MELVRELLENSRWKDDMRYNPQKLYEDKDCTEQIYNEMWMADWWIEKYVCTIYTCSGWGKMLTVRKLVKTERWQDDRTGHLSI